MGEYAGMLPRKLISFHCLKTNPTNRKQAIQKRLRTGVTEVDTADKRGEMKSASQSLELTETLQMGPDSFGKIKQHMVTEVFVTIVRGTSLFKKKNACIDFLVEPSEFVQSQNGRKLLSNSGHNRDLQINSATLHG